MNSTESRFLTGFCWEHNSLCISSEVITDANPIHGGVLCHLFFDVPGQPRKVVRGGIANQDRKIEMGGQIGYLRRQRCPSSVFSPLLPFVSEHSSTVCSPITHFHCPISFPISLSMLDENVAPHLRLILKHLFFCRQFSPESLMLSGTVCELGQKAYFFVQMSGSQKGK